MTLMLADLSSFLGSIWFALLLLVVGFGAGAFAGYKFGKGK